MDQKQHMQDQMTHQGPTSYQHDQGIKVRHAQEDQITSLYNPFLYAQAFHIYSKQMVNPAYQYDMIAATKLFYQTDDTISVYQAPLALFYPSLVATFDALAIASLASFYAFL